jgi:hypothetical protein
MQKPNPQTTEKGFIVIPINLSQNLHVGGQCICDSCNKASFNEMYYIPVLAGRTYCDECYNRWHSSAEFYGDDVIYERQKAAEFLRQF